MSSAQGLATPQLATKLPGRIGFMPRLLIGALPPMPSPLMQAPIFDLGALRLANIIVALALFSFLGTLAETAKLPRLDTLQRRALWVFAAYLLLFVVAFVRSIPNLPQFTAVFPKLFGTAVLPYVNYEFIAPLLYAFSFIYVVVLVRSADDLLDIFSSIALGVVLQALVVFYCFIENPQILSGDDRFGISGITDDVLGMHYNDVAATYIV